jgi:2-hydroxy-6-oxonona-2,4-dienedioate hydrolase
MAKRILLVVAATLIIAAVFISAAFYVDIKREYERVRASGIVLSSPYGNIEYTEGGAGPAVLVIHGSGGGYDQGELIADAVLGANFHSITPSRFGYLRSTFHEGATWDDQAHAYRYLLDHLGVDRVAVLAMSHGGPSALLFAALYPERVSSLTLVSCGVATSLDPGQVQADRRGKVLTSAFKFDFPYWLVSRLGKSQFMELMGATDTVIARLTPAQRRAVGNIIDFMNPASLRSAGVAFDNTGTLPGRRVAEVKAPTLIFHAADDTLQLYHNAEFAVSTIPDARLVSFERGGHLAVIVEQSRIRTAAQAHIRLNMRERQEEQHQ